MERFTYHHLMQTSMVAKIVIRIARLGFLTSLMAISTPLLAQEPQSAQVLKNQLMSPPRVDRVDAQPLLLLTQRLLEALDTLGTPLFAETKASLEKLKSEPDDAKVTASIQQLLDPLCIATVKIKENGSVEVVAGRSVEVEENG